MTASIDQGAALRLLLGGLMGNEPATSFIEIRSKRGTGGMRQMFVPCRQVGRAARALANQAQTTDVYVGCAPRVRESGTIGDIERSWSLWTDCDGRAALEALAKFSPPPSVVVKSGSTDHRHAWWCLREPVTPDHCRRINRRLALALGADRAATDPARILRPPMTLNWKSTPPRPVVCTRLELDVFTAAEVAGGLPDDPVYEVARSAPAHALRSSSAGALDGLVQFVRRAA